MANITISELRPAGYDLLHDSESFLNELAAQEIQNVVGGHSYSASKFGYGSHSGHGYDHSHSRHGSHYGHGSHHSKHGHWY
ncbi:hypothetical protein [Cylindrospermum sp. FACHB-282]|uniref:hypothetical protein n=1 Tax=Cylindrospermum sp. FACHB-282 TaxID=2692794 RepID=UPI001682AB32|nr:hypothetical protein [Cylindrospermum sp. FACHB-282]MBD2387184.1 hypothetical protein [Cylindrospermum sp. FACHB-282]